jgi:hypothetical protein
MKSKWALMLVILGLIGMALLLKIGVAPNVVSAQENPTVVTPAAAPQVLYVGNDNAGGQILQFSLPLTPSTTSNFTTTAGGNVVSLAVDANGNLAAGLLSGNVQFFPDPLSGASTATATFSNGGASNNGQLAFLNTGDLWAATVSNRVNRFNTPFSNASTPAAFVTDAGMVSDIGTAIDPAQNLYIATAGTGNAAACAGTSQPGGGCGSNLYVYAPPYTGAPIITPNVINFPFAGNSTAYRKIAVNATRLYAASVANGSGRVDVYNLPITAASTPAFALTTGVNTPEGLALDANGNLYIGNLSDATITVYSAPVAAASVPSLIFKVSTGAFAIFGIAIGQGPPSPPTIQFSSSTYSVGEGGGRVNITVTRGGDTSGAASVGFATIDDAGLTNCNVLNGTASPRCDYESATGTLTWAAGDATPKTFSVAIVDDSYAEGPETFRVSLNNPSGAALFAPSTATVTINDNEVSNGLNPIDNTNFFVRQQYLDFLGREPDPPGFAGWTSTINNCSGDTTQCDRIHVSQLFFQSAEFQQRGYFVYRFYPVAFGRKPDYSEFVPDLASVSGFLDANQLEAAKVAFIAGFMARPAFTSTYNSPNTMAGNQTYVDALLTTAGVTLLPSPATHDALIAGLNNSTLTRGQVLRQIVESPEVSTKYNHQAYVVMDYFGYLRRQPDGAYLAWIAVLDATNDPRAMVTGFVNSTEYRARFGP